MPLNTNRLTLSEITTDDHVFMRELVNTPGWIKFIGDRNVHSDEDALAYVNRILAAKDLTYWVIRLKDSRVPVGIISFLKRDYLEHFDIGFALLSLYEGKGYAFEAADAVLKSKKENPLHKKLYATTIPENTKSITLLEKLGFHFLKSIAVEELKLNVYADHVKV